MKTFQIPDPSSSDATTIQTYRLRSLATSGSEDKPYDESYEISRWSEFCASCFSYKSNPPPSEYFQRHYYNDPWRDASLVKIIECKKEKKKTDGGDGWEIAASTRIFKRTISTGEGKGEGGPISAGGIGEVCTSEHHRRRSLSKMLLQDAIETMGKMGMQASLLHASPALQAVYQRGGNYESVGSRWSVVSIPSRLVTETSDGDDDMAHMVRVASFPQDAEALSSIHRKYSESRFAGCIVRSNEYWTNYISKEIGTSLFVLTTGDDTAIGCLSLRERGGKHQLQEFSVDESHCSAGQVMDILLKAAVTLEGRNSETCNAYQNESFDLQLPHAVYMDTLAGKDHSSIIGDDAVTAREEDDVGWMYRPISAGDEEGYNMVERVMRGTDVPNHLVWPSDSF